MEYLFKLYHRSLPSTTAGKLVDRKLVHGDDVDAGMHAAQPLADQLATGEFAILEDENGNIVGYWGLHA
jgi:hypothetical protein